MTIPIQITFRNMDRSSALEARAKALASRLEHFYPRILNCHVVIEAPHRHHHKGKIYAVHIALQVPRRELVISRHHQDNHAQEDPYVALRDAFNAMTRRLQDHARRLRGDIKHHEPSLQGRVRDLGLDNGFGIIETADGREIPFTRNSLVGTDFCHLHKGDRVRFAESDSGSGPVASTVHLVGKRLPASH